jgi:protein-tyrosine phosphatase
MASGPERTGQDVVVKERRIPLDGATNFRDLGGYRCRNGACTRWGRVFRSDGLHSLTTSDLTVIRQLGIATVYDLRTEQERHSHPDSLPSIHLAVKGSPSGTRNQAGPHPLDPSESSDGEKFLSDLYGAMLANAGAGFGKLFTALADETVTPAVIHCTGGKDRTGLAAALLLEALGVDRDTVLDDYELSATYRLRAHQGASLRSLIGAGMAPEVAAAVLGTPRWAMATALDTLEADYGGIERYLSERAHMAAATVAALRTALTSSSDPSQAPDNTGPAAF